MPHCGFLQQDWAGRLPFGKTCYVLSVLLLCCLLQNSEGVTSQPDGAVPPKDFECAITPPADFKQKFLYIRDKERAITLLTSRRIPHLLLTKVVSIFLKKYLGYVNVTLIYDDGFFPGDVLSAFGYDDEASGYEWFIPNALANVEVWVPPAFTDDGYVTFNADSYLGVGGRQGWFFLTSLVGKYGILDHWRSFAESNGLAAKVFGRSSREMAALEPLAKNMDTGTYNCESPQCEKGVFTPPQCRASECSLLFSSHFNTSSFLMEQIVQLKLYVSVIWIGAHLRSDFIARNLHTRTNKSILFFHWTPDVVVQPFNLTSVAFPACTKQHTYETMDGPMIPCRYEMHLFHKFIWKGLRAADSYLYESLKRISLSPSEYSRLIDEHNKNQSLSLDQIACNWMLKNQTTWNSWRTGDSKPLLFFVGLFPLDAKVMPDYKVKFIAPGNLPAFTMAIDAINANNSVLPDHRVRSMAVNTACEPDIVMHEFIKIIKFTTQAGTYNKIIGIVGPACSDTVEPIAGVSKFFTMPIISYGAEGAIFSNRGQYPYFYRTIPENKIFRHVYLQLFKSLEWQRVASLTEDGQQYSEYLTPLQDLLQTNGISFHVRKYPQERETESMQQYLLSLKNRNYKIIIGDFYQHVARQVMCEALKLGMTGQQGYVWFLPRWYADEWYNMSKVNDSDSTHSCSTAEMLTALDGHMTLSYKYFANEDELTHENITVSQWKAKYAAKAQGLNVPLSDYAGFTYDATWTYALALNKLFREDHSYTSNLRSNKTMSRFIHYLDETNFKGVSGPVNFTHGTSRVTEIIVWQFNRTYREVGRFYPYPAQKDFGTLVLHKHKLKWPLGVLPRDGSKECIIENFRSMLGKSASCNAAIIVLCTITFGTLGVVLVLALFYLRRRYEQKLRRMEEMWKNENVFKKFQGWELQRSKVVINRKLGQGQFGTVYGGECQLNRQGWVAVAVKTLKLRSTIGEKLDFLFEAEIMKELDHDNIVKLLGVITQTEPVYTVMEFMLYGDLKTFLLARRNLINEKSRNDDDEVSNRRLTTMALDVAKALEYLADRNYVHRDVACRNCLVHTNLSVKLADFGMTRPLNENNYYRFSRIGLLPVRWMSIESLVEGVFTPSSDMWSYGVLLYEIITFGAFPYQGLNNNEVFEKVRMGYTLAAPTGVKPPLDHILKTCFHNVPQQRPTAAQLVIQLTAEPRLIAPCLEDPVFCSVPAESSSITLESKGTERSRRLSLSKSGPVPATGPPQVAATALQTNASNRKRSMSGNMILSTTWDDTPAGVIDALNLNGSLKVTGTRLPVLGNGCRNHLPPHMEGGERETLIKQENLVTGVTSDLL